MAVLPIAFITLFYTNATANKKITEERIKAISETKRHFDEFYREWRKYKNREAMNTLLAIGLGAVTAGMTDVTEEARTRRAVDEELRRHGL